jgi:transposase
MPGGRTAAPTTRRRPGRGRPSSLTDETMQVVERSLLNLASYDDAAFAAGIHPSTFSRWKARGEQDAERGRSSDYRDFYDRIERANRKVKALLTGRVLAGSRRDPKLALKILERRFAAEWAMKLEVTDKTPRPKASPRDRFLKRLADIEERQEYAATSLAGILKDEGLIIPLQKSNGGGTEDGGD